MSLVPFNKAVKPELTVDQAYATARKLYNAVGNAKTTEDKVNAVNALINSHELLLITMHTNLSHEGAWHAVDLVYAAIEQLPLDSRELFRRHEEIFYYINDLEQVYPQAANYYDNEITRLSNGGEQDPLRKAWQHGWRTARKTMSDLNDTQKHNVLVAHAESDIMKEMSLNAPWSAVDVYKALSDTHPLNGRTAFAEKYLLGGEAFAAVKRDCPQLARFYELKVEAMRTAEFKADKNVVLDAVNNDGRSPV